MFSSRNYLLFLSIALWGALITSIVVTLIVGGAEGIKQSIGGLILQFLGTGYWADRVRNKRALMGRFWVDNDSPEWEKIWFGGLALAALIAGALGVIWALL
jgi:hypothetical protein